MRRVSLKVGVGVITFIFGIVITSVWFIEPFSLSQALEVAPPSNIQTETTEEYAVYSVVIKDLIIKDKSSAYSLVIANQTSAYEDVGYLGGTTSEKRLQNMKQHYPSVSEETLLDYEAKITRPFKISPNFNLPVEYLLVDAKKLEKSEGFAAKSMIRLSKVGFNKEKNQAFVYVEYFCGLCGFGSFVLLEKENDIWKIKKSFGGWVS